MPPENQSQINIENQGQEIPTDKHGKKILAVVLIIAVLLVGGLVAGRFVATKDSRENNLEPNKSIADRCQTSFIKTTSVFPLGELELLVPSNWQQQSNVSGQAIASFRFEGDPRVDNRLASWFNVSKRSDWSSFMFFGDNEILLSSLDEIYTQHSITQNINLKDLIIISAPTHQDVDDNSFSYIESKDGLWRGYYYIRRYETQGDERYKPAVIFILLNKNEPNHLIISGEVDLDDQQRQNLDLRLSALTPPYSGDAYEGIMTEINKANSEFNILELPLETRCQIYNLEKVVKNLKFQLIAN